MDMEAIRDALAERFGQKRANHIATMLMPMIQADFYKMLKAAKPNTPVKEEYHIDDNTSVIEMQGYGCKPGAEPKVARVSIDHIQIWVNEHVHDE